MVFPAGTASPAAGDGSAPTIVAMTTVGGTVSELLKKEHAPCVSILMPTHRSAPENQQDPIRFKNLLRQAEEQLTSGGTNKRDIRALLDPLEEKIADTMFWRRQSDGLAVFRSSDSIDWVHTLWSLPELSVVGPHFHVKPLLRMATSEREFLILGISEHGAHLYRAQGESVVEITPATVTAIFAEQLDDHHRAGRQVHTAGMSSRYHAGDSQADLDKEILEESLRRADRELNVTVRELGAPVLLAGVQTAISLYRSHCSFSDLLVDGAITGNIEKMSPPELWEAGWPLAKAHFTAVEDQAIADYQKAAERGVASSDLGTVLAATSEGRVDRVLVAMGRQVWGSFDPATRGAEVHDTPSPGDEDLLNAVARFALTTGARLDVLPPGRMPSGSYAAASFRY